MFQDKPAHYSSIQQNPKYMYFNKADMLIHFLLITHTHTQGIIQSWKTPNVSLTLLKTLFGWQPTKDTHFVKEVCISSLKSLFFLK